MIAEVEAFVGLGSLATASFAWESSREILFERPGSDAGEYGRLRVVLRAERSNVEDVLAIVPD